jgi:acyl-CoA thioesterase I
MEASYERGATETPDYSIMIGMISVRGRRHAGAGLTGLLLVAGLLGLAGAGGGCRADSRAAPAPSEPERAPAAHGPSRADRPRIVALGDSLTAGLGLPPDEAYPAVLQQLVDAAGYEFEVVNMGVSGDTSAGGRRRLEWALDGDARVLVLALGANDGLRGLSTAEMAANLEAIIEQARARQVAVLLCGMEAPPNFGPDFTGEFRKTYADLAARHDVTFLPFLLDGIAGIPALNQADGIHPNAEGARRMAGLVWERLEPMLKAATTT